MIMMIWFNDMILWALSAHGQCHRCRRPFQSPQVPRRRACSCVLVAVTRCPQWHWRWHPKPRRSRRGSFLVLLHINLLRDLFRISQYNTSEINLCSKRDLCKCTMKGTFLFMATIEIISGVTNLQEIQRMIQSSPGTSAGLSPLPLHDSARCTKKGSQASCKNRSKMDGNGRWSNLFPCEKRLGLVTKLLSRKSMIGVVQVHHW